MSKASASIRVALDYLSGLLEVHALGTTALEILGYAQPIEEKLGSLMRSQIDWSAPGSVHRIPPEQLPAVLVGAARETAAGFQIQKSQTIVALWSGLEVLIEDLFVAWISEFPSHLVDEHLQKTKVSLAEFILLDEENRIRALYQACVGSLPGTRASGVTRFESLLAPLKLAGPVDAQVSEAIFELHLLRNLIAHQAGRADAKFRKTDFGSTYALGEKVYLHDVQFRNYAAAVINYGHTLLLRVEAAAV